MSEPVVFHEVLFHEYVGGGDDTESCYYANGIVVTLGRWETDNFRLRRHYTLTARVMINYEIVVDEIEIFQEHLFQADATMIRKAIARMDQLKELNPDCVKQEA